MDWKCLVWRLKWICLAIAIVTNTAMAANTSALTLSQAERIALSHAPELRQLQATSNALKQSAVAAGQFSDPKLILGAMNLPVDTFDLSQEPMTQLQAGLKQDFPRGHSLRYRSLKTQALAQAEHQKQASMRVQILRNVRQSWLTLYYWLHARPIVLGQKKVFRHLVSVTASLLANNKAQQKDVVRAQLELTSLDNQLITINQQIVTARAELARWIGPGLAKHANPARLPRWAKPPVLQQFQIMIQHHPELRTDQALIAASHAGVKFSQQQFKPGFSIGVAYGLRQGHNFDNSRRADFLTAMASIDLPLLPHNRQSRDLKASESNLIASEEGKDSHYRQLTEVLRTQYTAWQEQRRSSWLYRSRFIAEAKQYAEATLVAYQNNQTDFPTLARAYIRELKTQLDGLKAGVDRDKARANLLYLQGK